MEEALSTDYSSHFDEEESTLREEMSPPTVPPPDHSQARKKQPERRKQLRSPRQTSKDKEMLANSSSSSNNSSLAATTTTNSGEEGQATASKVPSREMERSYAGAEISPGTTDDSSSSSSFVLFTQEMKRQELSEAALRDRLKAALFKLQEKTLVATARQELAAIEQQMSAGNPLAETDERALRRKQRAILLRLKERQKEIGRLREELRVAERNRQSLMEEQQKILAKRQRSRPHTASKMQPANDKARFVGGAHPLLDTTMEDSVHSEDKEEEANGLMYRRRLATNGSTGRNIESAGQAGSEAKIAKEVENSGRDETDMLSGARSTQVETMPEISSGVTVPPALLPIPPQRLSSLRIRHASGGESEAETPTALLRDHLGDITTSDQSDVEARISALNEQLRTRIRTAARLKKEQERRRTAAQNRAEQLRGQEAALRKQIEVYDQLISQGLAEEGALPAAAATFSKPKIKSPKSSLAAGFPLASSARRERRTESSSRSSAPTSPDQSVSFSQALGGERQFVYFWHCVQ